MGNSIYVFSSIFVYIQMAAVIAITGYFVYYYIKNKKDNEASIANSLLERSIYWFVLPLVIVIEVSVAIFDIWMMQKEAILKFDIYSSTFGLSSVVLLYILYKTAKGFTGREKVLAISSIIVLSIISFLFYAQLYMPTVVEQKCFQVFIETAKSEDYKNCLGRYSLPDSVSRFR